MSSVQQWSCGSPCWSVEGLWFVLSAHSARLLWDEMTVVVIVMLMGGWGA